MEKIAIYFRAFLKEDAKFINDLRKLDSFENLVGGNKRFVSLDRERKWIEDLIFSDYKDRFYVAICEDHNNNIIGYTSVSNIDHYNKSCFWSGIKIHPDYHGKGYAFQTTMLILKYVFEEMNMERVTAECIEENVIAKKLMEKAGFIIEGLFRNSLYKSGKYHNQFKFSILKNEFLSLNI